MFDILVFRKQRAEWFPALFCRSAVFHKVVELLDCAGKYSLKETRSEEGSWSETVENVSLFSVCGFHLIALSIFMQR